MLKECIQSLLAQSFGDFEVIVGNDYVAVPVTAASVGITDSRITFVNHEKNLGEVDNMNTLLRRSRGRFFTWLADDDMYSPAYLETMRRVLTKEKNARAFFCQYAYGHSFEERIERYNGPVKTYNGRSFLLEYLARNIRLSGCYGMFEREYMLSEGGMRKMGKGSSIYSDVLMAIRAGLLEWVGFVPEPLIFFRTHQDSLSNSVGMLEDYVDCQSDLMKHSMDVFQSAALSDDRDKYLNLTLRWCLRDFCSVMKRGGRWDGAQFKKWFTMEKMYLCKMRCGRMLLLLHLLRRLTGLRIDFCRRQ